MLEPLRVDVFRGETPFCDPTAVLAIFEDLDSDEKPLELLAVLDDDAEQTWDVANVTSGCKPRRSWCDLP